MDQLISSPNLEDTNRKNWTDDLPRDSESGVGRFVNRVIRFKNGERIWDSFKEREDEDFNFNISDNSPESLNLSLVGVLDGFGGRGCADFLSKKIPAEILLGQISGDPEISDARVRDTLKNAFLSSDREYFDVLGESAARAVAKGSYSKELDFEGASGTVCLIINESKLFVANVGDTAAVLYESNSDNSSLTALRVSVDHVIDVNEDENLRFNLLGVFPDKIGRSLGDRKYTRCIGHGRVKGNYKDIFTTAKGQPVISIPEIQGSIDIKSQTQFLLIFSRPFFEAYKSIGPEPWDPAGGNDGFYRLELGKLVKSFFERCSNVSEVAQSVVNRVVEEYKASCLKKSVPAIEDITLLIRNFNTRLGVKRKNETVSLSSTNSTHDKVTDETIPETVEAYVDFSYFYKAFEEHRKKQSKSCK